MKTTKKLISFLLVFVMVLCLMPANIIATQTSDEEYVYLSISFDKHYINDKNGEPIVYRAVSMKDIAAVDLTEYGLDNMLYDADGDDEYETTALQLLIYAHEELYGGDWGEVNFDALPGSSYFKGGIFGFTENLVYFHNGDFPVDESQQSDYMTVGATSDRIVLEAGDFLDVASFECFNFLWDQLGGFHLFADENGDYVHDYEAVAGEALSVKLKHSFCDLTFGESWVKEATDFEVFYGSVYGEAEGSVTTDDEGNAEITFDTAGTYYVWSEGGHGSDDGNTHTSCDYYNEYYEPCVVSSPAYARVTVTGGSSAAPEETTTEETTTEETTTEETTTEETTTEETTTEETTTEESTSETPTPEEPKTPQSVSSVLKATLAQLVATVKEPSFGTNAGEWTVFSIARGGYLDKDNVYFADYYDRIVATVNETAAKLDKNGALDKNKSTENSRLIVALSAIGKDATSVGNWDLVEAYSANGINWIKKQGMNGTIWTLIALDSGNYETSDSTVRQQCVDAILSAQHNDGGWSLVTAKTQPSNVDITGMTLTALYPYRDQPAVAAACATAIEWLSASQLDNGGFPYGKGETSESCAWAIVALTTWGINPDTDPRFIKNGYSAIDNLLTYYIEEEAMFEHGIGAGANAMATDQACYALVAYDRFINDKTALFDYSDVTFDAPEHTVVLGEPAVLLGLPANVSSTEGTKFNGVLSIDQWDSEGGYKLIDFIITVPTGVSVTDVTVGTKVNGGEVQYHLEEETGKLRVVYFDANAGTPITINTSAKLTELFTIGFEIGKLPENVAAVNIAITGMSLKTSSDSTDNESTTVVNTNKAQATVTVSKGMTVSAMTLYSGDDVDLIPSGKKAVAVSVTNVEGFKTLTYNDGETTINFYLSVEITDKSGVATYVAMIDSDFDMKNLANGQYYKITEASPSEILFGDVNGDGEFDAQDALAVVNAWLRKGNAPTDEEILKMNVNGDSRINTYDALAIVEKFVDGYEWAVVNKAATNLGE